MSRLKHADALALADLMHNELAGTDFYLERQLAEECVEYAHAIYKIIRAINGETPVSPQDALKNVLEEFADVLLMGDIVYAAIKGKTADRGAEVDRWYKFKRKRIVERLKEMEDYE